MLYRIDSWGTDGEMQTKHNEYLWYTNITYILSFLEKGKYLFNVVVPENAKIIKDPNNSKVFGAKKITLSNKRKITVPLIEDLVREGADVNWTEVLLWAVWRENFKDVRYLVKKYQNFINWSEGKLLFAAVSRKRWEIADYLLDMGADASYKGSLAFGYAVDLGLSDLTIFEKMVKNGATVNSDRNVAVEYAARRGNKELVKWLLKSGCTIETPNPILREGVEAGNLELVKLLIVEGADIERGWNSPLTVASEKGYLDITKYLIEKGARVDAGNFEPIKRAASNGHFDIVRLLVEKGSAIPDRCVCDALKKGATEDLQFLINQGAKLPKQKVVFA